MWMGRKNYERGGWRLRICGGCKDDAGGDFGGGLQIGIFGVGGTKLKAEGEKGVAILDERIEKCRG